MLLLCREALQSRSFSTWQAPQVLGRRSLAEKDGLLTIGRFQCCVTAPSPPREREEEAVITRKIRAVKPNR